MIEILLIKFINTWMLALVALILGRYVGYRGTVIHFPTDIKRLALIYVQAWVITFVAQMTFGFLGYSMRWSEAAQNGFAEFLMPLIAGAYAARQLILLDNRRTRR